MVNVCTVVKLDNKEYKVKAYTKNSVTEHPLPAGLTNVEEAHNYVLQLISNNQLLNKGTSDKEDKGTLTTVIASNIFKFVVAEYETSSDVRYRLPNGGVVNYKELVALAESNNINIQVEGQSRLLINIENRR